VSEYLQKIEQVCSFSVELFKRSGVRMLQTQHISGTFDWLVCSA